MPVSVRDRRSARSSPGPGGKAAALARLAEGKWYYIDVHQAQETARIFLEEFEHLASAAFTNVEFNLWPVKDVRVKGAIGVVELDRMDDLEGLRARFVELGVFVRPFGSIVYLTPAFTISPDELETLTGAVRRVIAEL